MGDLQTDQGESLDLQYVPVSEFRRLMGSDPVTRIGSRGLTPSVVAAFAALARINTLYMITGAWSGHIGTSFSSLEIMSWLFLNEIRDLDKGDDRCDIFFSSKGHDAPALNYFVLYFLILLRLFDVIPSAILRSFPAYSECPLKLKNTCVITEK